MEEPKEAAPPRTLAVGVDEDEPVLTEIEDGVVTEVIRVPPRAPAEKPLGIVASSTDVRGEAVRHVVQVRVPGPPPEPAEREVQGERVDPAISRVANAEAPRVDSDREPLPRVGSADLNSTASSPVRDAGIPDRGSDPDQAPADPPATAVTSESHAKSHPAPALLCSDCGAGVTSVEPNPAGTAMILRPCGCVLKPKPAPPPEYGISNEQLAALVAEAVRRAPRGIRPSFNLGVRGKQAGKVQVAPGLWGKAVRWVSQDGAVVQTVVRVWADNAQGWLKLQAKRGQP